MVSGKKVYILRILFTGLLIFSVSGLEARESEIKTERTKGYYFGFGTALINTDEMESKLLSSGFKKPKEWAYLFSAGFYGKRRFVFDLAFNMLRWKPVEMGVNQTKLHSFTSSLNFGLNVLPLSLPIALYPYVGSGFGKSKMSLNQTSVDFSRAVTTPPISFQVSQYSFFFVTGVGYDFKFEGRKVLKKKFTTGIQLGYRFDVTDDNDWESEEVEITNGPKLKATGFYVKVLLGRNLKKYRINKDVRNEI